MAGLLGAVMGAIGGAGEAVQTNAKLELQKRKEAALMQLRHDYTMKQQDDQQKFTGKQNDADRAITKDRNQALLAESRADRAAANQRNAATIAAANERAQMGLLQRGMTSDGSTAYYNPATGSLTEAPQEWAPAQDGTAYERRQDSINHLDNQIDELMKIQTSDAWRTLPSAEQSRVTDQLNSLRDQREQLASSTWNIPAARQAPQASAPESAINYLKKNDSPAMRSAFREKYGYLPEGF